MSSSTQNTKSVDACMQEDTSLAIVAEGLGKCYEMFDKPADRLKQAVLRRPYGHSFWALRDVSFSVRKGEALGVVGHNGAGKSTLLQILAGALKPSRGEARLRGRVASLLELGSGFLPDFTGRENVFLNGTALGLSTKEIGNRLDEIREFAEIGDFFDQPVKTYSSGMFVRLAFAVQACLAPDILIVDEALAVGDIFFQQKCHAHMAKLLERGVAILLVTHDVQAVRKYCSSALLLENGNVVYQGDIEDALRLYAHRGARESVDFEALSSQTPKVRVPDVEEEEVYSFLSDSELSWPADDAFFPPETGQKFERQSGGIRFDRIALCNDQRVASTSFEQNQYAYFYLEVTALRDLEQLAIGLTLTSKDNLPYYCKNTVVGDSGMPKKIREGTGIRIEWKVAMSLARGDYTFSVGSAEYPEWVTDKLDQISPEHFSTLSQPILDINKVASFTVCTPSRGIKMPFMGMVDMSTQIKSQKVS